MTAYGTAYFPTFAAACRYYAKQGHTAIQVNERIANQTIHIGEPALKDGERLILIDGGDRWAIVVPTTMERRLAKIERAIARRKPRIKGPYPMCRTPEVCSQWGYCRRDPACSE